MKRAWFLGMVAVLGSTLIVGSSAFGAEQQKTGKQTANKPVGSDATAKAADAKNSTPHLPRGWKELGLSTEQHDKVIAVLQKYAAQIRPLQAQIGNLRKNRDAEMAAILNDKQRTQLAEAKAAASEKAKSATAEKMAAKKVTRTAAKPVLPAGTPDLSKVPTLEQLKERIAKARQANKEATEKQKEAQDKPQESEKK